jgi:membrane-bound lytic murein transglycosylase B
MVAKHGFTRSYLNAALSQAVYQPQIIESMTKPYEKKPWDVYKQLFLTNERIERGMAFWQANKEALARAEKQYQVPANIIVAIIGIETIYGKHQGNYRVLDALSTLAFYYPARAPFFKKELAEFFLLCREHRVAPTEYLGSYAGAMGKPQFMPSSYRFYAADFVGNTKKDLMHDDEAVIASVANYIHKHGWRFYQGVAEEARVRGHQYKRIHTEYKNAVYTPSQLAQAGIRPLSSMHSTSSKAGFLEFVTDKGPEFWLAYPNFYVITRYNTSPQYAMAVYLLSSQLKNQQMAHTSGWRGHERTKGRT